MERRCKKPLIAWGTFTKKKAHGGLGWPKMDEIADAFLLKNTVKNLQGGPEDWVAIAGAIINFHVQNSSCPNEIKRCSQPELFLGLKSLRTPSSTTLNRMLTTWFKVKFKLAWSPEDGTHPRPATPRFILALLMATETIDEEEGRALKLLYSAARITNTSQLQNQIGRTKSKGSTCPEEGKGREERERGGVHGGF
ncbi:hypothetical protein R1sor_020041 [Riccia sorocarpa]|uniref:Uncharacterized protein n=1 Tax=Riccia sorocarpa TaxID=122646 RepID=A0ABD3IKH8_9MARC